MKIILENEEYLSIEDVEKLVNQKSPTIDMKVRYGVFPKPIKLRVVKFWKKSEIDSYLEGTREKEG